MVIAFIIRGLKEFGEPTRKAMIMDLARRMPSIYFGTIICSGCDSCRLNLGIFSRSPQLNFLTASAFGLLGTLYLFLR